MTWMKETFRMFDQMTLLDTPNAISSPGSADGNSPSCEQAGPMIARVDWFMSMPTFQRGRQKSWDC